jgi:hypothetical protein
VILYFCTDDYSEKAERHGGGEGAPVLVPFLGRMQCPRLGFVGAHPVDKHEEDTGEREEGCGLHGEPCEGDLFDDIKNGSSWIQAKYLHLTRLANRLVRKQRGKLNGHELFAPDGVFDEIETEPPAA